MWGQLSRSGILKTKKREDNVGREGQEENKGEAIEELTAKRPADLQQQRCKWWHLATRGLIGPPSWIFLKGLWLFCHFVWRQTALLSCCFFSKIVFDVWGYGEDECTDSLPWIQPECTATAPFHCEIWGRSSRPRTAWSDPELDRERGRRDAQGDRVKLSSNKQAIFSPKNLFFIKLLVSP